MKKKKKSWSTVPWTPFTPCAIPENALYRSGDSEPPLYIVRNSRYQVAVWVEGAPDFPVWGEWAHLSIKVHDRQAYHDWRDLQRIKNEVIGPEYDAVEIYPDEAKLVDSANQYHLFVFRKLKLPFGFQTRLVADGQSTFAPEVEQRPFDVVPPDCLRGEDLDTLIVSRMMQQKEANR
jgi:hypothetical protein